MISVLMGLHRFDKYVFPAIDSILAQDGVELELIVVSNGKDASNIAEKIRIRYLDESRIRLFQTPIAQLAHALNVALSHARYEYVARMDADDISHSNRLRDQLDYLIANDLDLVGSAVRLIDADGNEVGSRNPPRKNKINKLLPYKSCFVHPTVLFKKKVLLEVGGYNAGFNSEDYDLWLRLLRKNTVWDNMSSPLLDYRIHGEASQRRLLGYAEVSGLMLREFIFTKKYNFFFAMCVSVLKSFFRSR